MSVVHHPFRHRAAQVDSYVAAVVDALNTGSKFGHEKVHNRIRNELRRRSLDFSGGIVVRSDSEGFSSSSASCVEMILDGFRVLIFTRDPMLEWQEGELNELKARAEAADEKSSIALEAQAARHAEALDAEKARFTLMKAELEAKISEMRTQQLLAERTETHAALHELKTMLAAGRQAQGDPVLISPSQRVSTDDTSSWDDVNNGHGAQPK